MSKKNKSQIKDQEMNKNPLDQQPVPSSTREQAKGRAAKDDYKSRY